MSASPGDFGGAAESAHLTLILAATALGYQINETWEVEAYLDHISNGGLAKYNQSINDVGLRLGFRF